MKACKEAAENVIPLKPKLKKRLLWEILYICQKREILHQTAELKNSDPTQRNIKNFRSFKIHSQTQLKENKRNMLLERLKKYKTQLVLQNQHSPGKQLTK